MVVRDDVCAEAVASRVPTTRDPVSRARLRALTPAFMSARVCNPRGCKRPTRSRTACSTQARGEPSRSGHVRSRRGRGRRARYGLARRGHIRCGRQPRRGRGPRCGRRCGLRAGAGRARERERVHTQQPGDGTPTLSVTSAAVRWVGALCALAGVPMTFARYERRERCVHEAHGLAHARADLLQQARSARAQVRRRARCRTVVLLTGEGRVREQRAERLYALRRLFCWRGVKGGRGRGRRIARAQNPSPAPARARVARRVRAAKLVRAGSPYVSSLALISERAT
jgi:hypothetical protein